jgi:hypothetical protein
MPVARVLTLLAIFLSACSPDDEAQAQASLEAPPASSAYYSMRQDLRVCIWPFCGGVFLRGVNLEKTTCADGSLGTECYVARLETDAVLPESALGDLKHIIMHGRITPGTRPITPRFFELRADGVWRAVTAAPASGPVWRVSSHGGELIAVPLNGTAGQRLGALDLSAVALSAEQKVEVGKALSTGRLVVAGNLDASALHASQIYLPIGASELFNVNTAAQFEVQR